MRPTLYEECGSLCKRHGLDPRQIDDDQIMLIGTNILILEELRDINTKLDSIEYAANKTE